jgi:integrase
VEESTTSKRTQWTTRKTVEAPRGLSRIDGQWRITFTCGAGHIHRERVGKLKSVAEPLYHEWRNRAKKEPGWCPRAEARRARERAAEEQARERARVLFATYARDDYGRWAKIHHRSAATTESQIERLVKEFGGLKLDEITSDQIERFLDRLSEPTIQKGANGEEVFVRGLAPATANRYRDRLSGMFKRALRFGLVTKNPVTGIPKRKEPSGRVVYLTPLEEQAVHDALPDDKRALFVVSVNTGLRWSEQTNLTWGSVDVHAGTITIPRSKHGETRHVPMNSLVRSVLYDLSLKRQHTDDPTERVFRCQHAQADKFFPKAVKGAQAALRAAGHASSGLDGYTWHGNRHTFASRLVMAGVDLRTVQELGGWKSLKMVQRYSHLAPGHLHEAVERLAVASAGRVSGAQESPK